MSYDDETNMFVDCGEAGFYVNSFGNKQNLIIVDCKNGTIYSKEAIPLGNKIYLSDETYLGMIAECVMINNTVGNIHEIVLDDYAPKINLADALHNTDIKFNGTITGRTTHSELKLNVKPEKVLCNTCNQPIKVEELGAITKDGIFHDNLACLSPVELQQ